MSQPDLIRDELLLQVCLLKMRRLVVGNPILDCMIEEAYDGNEQENKFADRLIDLALKCEAYARTIQLSDEDLASLYVKLAYLLDSAVSGIELYLSDEHDHD